MEEGLAAHAITRSSLLRPYYFVLLAGALLRVKEFTRAQRALDGVMCLLGQLAPMRAGAIDRRQSNQLCADRA